MDQKLQLGHHSQESNSTIQDNLPVLLGAMEQRLLEYHSQQVVIHYEHDFFVQTYSMQSL